MPRKSLKPLVSCIMPTHNRRDFARLAFEYFLRQDYAQRELIVVDDGSEPIGDMTPCDPRIRYIHIGARASIGAKRNLACEQARGEIIVHWDDDDWSSSRRISTVVAALQREQADLCGLNPVLFYDLRSGEAWKYRYPPEDRFWVHGNSLGYRRSFWEQNPFADLNVGEDNQFIWNAPAARMLALDSTCVVGMLHDRNVSARPGGGNWNSAPVKQVRQILGQDWRFYENGVSSVSSEPEPDDFVAEIAEPETVVTNIAPALPPRMPLQEHAAVTSISHRAGTLIDCLGRAEITIPETPIRAERCIVSIISTSGYKKGYPYHKNYLVYFDDLLGSLAANADCRDARLVTFVDSDEPEAERIAHKHGSTIIRFRPLTNVNATLKAVMYSTPHVVDAKYFLCMDADMLVLGDLNPIFSVLEALPQQTILAVPELNHTEPMTLLDALHRIYYGSEPDIERILGAVRDEARYPVVVNDGLFAGSRAALLALDDCIRQMPQAIAWTDERDDVWWRNQFIFNLALARMQCGCYLDHTYNLQLHFKDAEVHVGPGGPRAYFEDRPVRVLHRNGHGREKYPQLSGYYARVAEPLSGGQKGGDSYSQFLRALRAWIGRHGVDVMAWSFYGTGDMRTSRIGDTDTLPLLGMLHYLIRSNGCTRVLETGTARGVSAACMASAVAHRQNGRVVTFDINTFPEREDLWSGLPSGIRACIEPRTVDCFSGMMAAWASGERYDAALLDTVHTEDHVWEEFQWASKLVCPGGLILIHDARYALGTVEGALRRIEAAGYGVVRLWTGETAVCEDDHLGLAIVENRRRV